MIWSYLIPSHDRASYKRAYGCPVTVAVGGKRYELVYQFPGGGQKCAVVHWPTGAVVAFIEDAHVGAPQERAQQAVDGRLGHLTSDRFEAVCASQPVLNALPRVEGVFGR